MTPPNRRIRDTTIECVRINAESAPTRALREFYNQLLEDLIRRSKNQDRSRAENPADRFIKFL